MRSNSNLQLLARHCTLDQRDEQHHQSRDSLDLIRLQSIQSARKLKAEILHVQLSVEHMKFTNEVKMLEKQIAEELDFIKTWKIDRRRELTKGVRNISNIKHWRSSENSLNQTLKVKKQNLEDVYRRLLDTKKSLERAKEKKIAAAKRLNKFEEYFNELKSLDV